MAKTFTITCYGKTKEYPESQRKKMIKEFETAMLCCDGSEAERYRNIYGDLVAGKKECMDIERPLSPIMDLGKTNLIKDEFQSGWCQLRKCKK